MCGPAEREICPGWPRAQQLQLCVSAKDHYTPPAPPLAFWLTAVNAPMPIDRSDSFEVVFGVFLVQDLALFSNSREGCAKTHTHRENQIRAELQSGRYFVEMIVNNRNDSPSRAASTSPQSPLCVVSLGRVSLSISSACSLAT